MNTSDQQYPTVSRELVDYLRQMFPPLQAKPGEHGPRFSDLCYSAGQQSILDILQAAAEKQTNSRREAHIVWIRDSEAAESAASPAPASSGGRIQHRR